MKRIINIMICLILLSLSGCILVKPKTLDFGSDETTNTFKLTVIGNVEWTINYSESWLTVDPDSGQGTATINVTVDRTGLDDDSYEAILNISTNPNLPCPDVIVTMTVGETTTSSTTTSSPSPPPKTTTSSPTTTTTISGGEPDPYIPDSGPYFRDYIWDNNAVCVGSIIYVRVINRGGPGLVYVGIEHDYVSIKPRSDCSVFHMNREEVGSVAFFLEDYCDEYERTFYLTPRPALPGEDIQCNHPPFTVDITSPSSRSTYVIDDSITFSGEAYDLDEGNLEGNSLVWVSDIDGQIGTGESFTSNDLSTGLHTITLTATDSHGGEKSDSVWIFIDYMERKVWEFEVGGSVSSPSVSDGYVYVGKSNKVYCLNAQTGDKVWEFTPTTGTLCPYPAVSGGYVYVVSSVAFDDSKVHCLNAQTGDKVWEFTITFATQCSYPAVSGGYLYVVWLSQSHLYCLDAKTGDKIWESFLGMEIGELTTPAVLDGSIYVGGSMWTGSKKGKVYCLNTQNGENIWEYETVAEVYSSPAVSGGYVYVGSDDGKVYCLDAENGTKKWDYQTEGSIKSSPAVEGGYVYVGSDDGKFYRLDAQTGNSVFVWNLRSGVRSSPAVSGQYVYVGYNAGLVFGLDFNDNKIDWMFMTGSGVLSSPALSNGYVYVGSNDGKVYCLKAIEGDTGSWPMFKYNPARTGAK